MTGRRLVIIGAGGQARETRWIVSEITPGWAFVGFVVTDLARLGPHDSREHVLGDYGWLRENRDRFDALAIGIGTPRVRLKVAQELEQEFGLDVWPLLAHPSAIFDRASATCGRGVLVHPGVLGTVNLVINDHAMINNGCTIGHETIIGRGCVVNPGANLAGGVVLGDGVLVGTGAQILQYLRVGDGATVGAGAVVTRDVPAGSTVVGAPAKPMAPRGQG